MTMKKWSAVALGLMMLTAGMTGCAKEVAAETPEVVAETVVETSEVSEAREALFVSVEDLQGMMAEGQTVVIDVRGEDAYNGGHIEGAIMTSWQGLSTMDVDFATENWGAVTDAAKLSQSVSALGLTKDSHVVLYGDTEKGWGEDGRVYWTLKMAGIDNVQILDGGINLWNDANLGLSTEATSPVPSDFEVASLNFDKSINTETLAANYMAYKVLDTRDLDEFEGAVKFGEARGGHLPSAIHLPYKSLLNKDGSLKTDQELLAIFEAAGLSKEDKIATYCTAGIRSAHVAVILDMLGYDQAVNYDESYYVWANNPEMPLGQIVKGKAYNYYSQDQVKGALEDASEMLLVDIQVADEYAAHHIQNAIETNAFPVKSDEEKEKLNDVIAMAEADDAPVVIVCPRGGGGAQRTFDYMVEKGINPAQLYILEKGQEGWPYEALLAD